MATGAFRDLGTAPIAEGIITLTMDRKRGRLYGLTWPRGLFILHDIDAGRTRSLGPVSGDGEVGEGERYMCLCRAFGLVPDTGVLYMTNPTGDILRFEPESDKLVALEHESLWREILGAWDSHKPGHQGYNWRTVVWHPRHRVFLGVHPGSGMLFQFDPATERLELIDRISADQVRRSGRFEPFRYGYLTLALGPDEETLYYLTGTHGFVADGGRQLTEVSHLISYNIRSGQHIDHGVLRLEDGRYVVMSQTLVAHPNGTLYTCPWIDKPNRAPDDRVEHQVDLVSLDTPAA
jgi:hypothetical protein